MNAVLTKVCTALFSVVVPLLLAIRFAWPRRMPWWVTFVLASGLGWVLINLTVHFSQAHTNDLVVLTGGFERASPELIEDWANDGGPRTFAFVLGWVPGLLYLLPWLALYGIADRIRSGRSRGTLPPNKSLERTRER
jgi:hypothetical protein